MMYTQVPKRYVTNRKWRKMSGARSGIFNNKDGEIGMMINKTAWFTTKRIHVNILHIKYVVC